MKFFENLWFDKIVKEYIEKVYTSTNRRTGGIEDHAAPENLVCVPKIGISLFGHEENDGSLWIHVTSLLRVRSGRCLGTVVHSWWTSAWSSLVPEKWITSHVPKCRKRLLWESWESCEEYLREEDFLALSEWARKTDTSEVQSFPSKAVCVKYTPNKPWLP